MRFEQTTIKDNFLIHLEKKEDNRGFFARYFCEREFSERGLNTRWVQINNSETKEEGTIRGLHYQREPNSEVKLIRCLKGIIWDVVVDLRDGSESFGKWFGAQLSDKNRTMMYVPKGFAHGFISLEPSTEILYLVSDFYTPNAEGTLIWNDPDVAISWPVLPKLISDKDQSGYPLKKIKPIKLQKI